MNAKQYFSIASALCAVVGAALGAWSLNANPAGIGAAAFIALSTACGTIATIMQKTGA